VILTGKLREIVFVSWSDRADLNRRPLAPQAYYLIQNTFEFISSKYIEIIEFYWKKRTAFKVLFSARKCNKRHQKEPDTHGKITGKIGRFFMTGKRRIYALFLSIISQQSRNHNYKARN
jgi:hypothetical protein